jgi:glycosyltransferase involved in cell wall biosynthesis
MAARSEVLVIVPAYNEAQNIEKVINDLSSTKGDWDILVINDASRDNTSELARSTGKATVIDLPYNLGIGGGVQTGFKYARKNGYKFTLQFDGDGQHNAEEIQKLIGIVKSGEADVAIGSRFTQKHDGFKSSFLRRIGIRSFEFFSYFLIRQRITDHTSGFRAYNEKALCFLSEHYPTDYPEPEVVILLGRNGFRMKEVFTQMHERKGGISSIPVHKGPYYMTKVMLSMFMAAIRTKVYKHE